MKAKTTINGILDTGAVQPTINKVDTAPSSAPRIEDKRYELLAFGVMYHRLPLQIRIWAYALRNPRSLFVPRGVRGLFIIFAGFG